MTELEKDKVIDIITQVIDSTSYKFIRKPLEEALAIISEEEDE